MKISRSMLVLIVMSFFPLWNSFKHFSQTSTYTPKAETLKNKSDLDLTALYNIKPVYSESEFLKF